MRNIQVGRVRSCAALLAVLVGAVAVGVSVPADAVAFKIATGKDRAGMKSAERQSADGYDKPHQLYRSTVSKNFGVGCVDQPGFSNTVFGRTYVRRNGRWRNFDSFNTGNVNSESRSENGWSGPANVYRDLQRAIARCAARLGAEN